MNAFVNEVKHFIHNLRNIFETYWFFFITVYNLFCFCNSADDSTLINFHGRNINLLTHPLVHNSWPSYSHLPTLSDLPTPSMLTCALCSGVLPLDSQDSEGWSRSHCFLPGDILHGEFPDWYKRYDEKGGNHVGNTL